MQGLMKALVKKEAAAGFAMESAPIPSYGNDEVLIRVRYASLCGTDLHIYNWDNWAAGRINPPLIVGHELSGEIVAVGNKVAEFQIGDYIAAETHIVCGTCSACRRGDAHICINTKIIGVDRDGCFAEYISLPACNLWKIGDSIPLDIASLMEPMGNAVHALLNWNVASKAVAVLGCGPIGLIAIAVAKAAGASKVIAIDPNQYRLSVARNLGAVDAISPVETDVVQTVRGLTAGLGADIVLEMSGNTEAIKQAFAMLAHGGAISMLGLPTTSVDLDVTGDIIFKGISLYGVIGRRMYQTWEQTSKFLASGLVDLEPLVTHRLPLAKYEEAFALMQSGNCGKVILEV